MSSETNRREEYLYQASTASFCLWFFPVRRYEVTWFIAFKKHLNSIDANQAQSLIQWYSSIQGGVYFTYKRVSLHPLNIIPSIIISSLFLSRLFNFLLLSICFISWIDFVCYAFLISFDVWSLRLLRSSGLSFLNSGSIWILLGWHWL